MPSPSTALYAERATLPPQEERFSLWRSLLIQKRVISALILREVLTRFGRRNLGFLWLFVEPALFIIVLAAIWHAMNGPQKSGVPVEAFVLTGYTTVLLWRNMPGRCIKAMRPNVALLYHRHVRPIDIYLARAGLEAAAGTMSFVALAIAFILAFVSLFVGLEYAFALKLASAESNPSSSQPSNSDRAI